MCGSRLSVVSCQLDRGLTENGGCPVRVCDRDGVVQIAPAPHVCPSIVTHSGDFRMCQSEY